MFYKSKVKTKKVKRLLTIGYQGIGGLGFGDWDIGRLGRYGNTDAIYFFLIPKSPDIQIPIP